jgi:beta-1,3-galactosyltransferase 1
MVVLIKSIPQNYERRRLIRETWFKTLPKLDVHIEAYFFVGLPQDKNITVCQNRSRKLVINIGQLAPMQWTYRFDYLQVISNEASKYGDIIIEDLEENYYLLAVKTLRMLKWFSSNCASRAQYFMKTDDDMFIHFPNLISHINSVPNQWVNYIGGQVHIRDPVNRDPDAKWFAPQDWWPDPYYPPFVSGALTVIASETVPKLLESSLNVPLYHLEDVFLIAMVAFEKLQILPNEIPRIISNSPEWIIRIRMALSSQDMAKTHIAFHCPNDPDLMRELFGRAFSDGINLRNKE